ncbi:hypothetical protein L195_g041128 [Trifolium pratense]|uniref:Uncharacterized protein n=1 Tax=Trifolium pratense TaxID=57577 RepID=A0A2K3M2T1_TRIPR|nr:hypothetical protein L195_g041128 [Trifolium pratense]
MDKVYRAIGSDWMVIVFERPEYSNAKSDKIMGNMYLFQSLNGILDHYAVDPDWA